MNYMQRPEINPRVSNWWYHYFCEGYGMLLKSEPKPVHFIRAKYKVTPDFNKMIYCYGWCHPQIGMDSGLTEGKSIVLLKSSAAPTWPYIVGFYRVFKIHGREKKSNLWKLRREAKKSKERIEKTKSREESKKLKERCRKIHERLSKFYITMDPKCSLLLLDSPIRIDLKLAKRLWPSGLFNLNKLGRQVSSRLRNARAKEKELEIVLDELFCRFESGSKNYMGESYRELCKSCERA